MFEAYGSKVSIFTRSQKMLRMEDVEISDRFTELFSKRVDLYPCQIPGRVERRPTGIVIHCHDHEVEVDELLVATGREPNTDLIACAWRLGNDLAIVTANVTGRDAHGLVEIGDLPDGESFDLTDQLSDQTFTWTRADLDNGLYVRLRSGDAHLFLIKPA